MDAKGFELLMSAKILGEGGGVSMDAKGFERLMAAKILGKGSGGKIKELEGVPPLTFTANGQPLIDYLISGNTVQTGTPTPENPIMPIGCGEKTENIMDVYSSYGNKVVFYSGVTFDFSKEPQCITINGQSSSMYPQVQIWGENGVSHFENGKTYTALIRTTNKPKNSYVYMLIQGCDAEGNWSTIVNISSDMGGISFSVSKDYVDFRNIFVCQNTGITYDNMKAYFMLTAGSTAPTSYIPYGYKLPITLGSTTTNIYLGEVQTTRRIKKLVLTGGEDWHKSAVFIGSAFVYLRDIAPNAVPFSPIVCTHLGNNTRPYQYGNGCIDENSLSLWLLNESVTPTNFKSFLAAQYANGTPVTVWYVLDEPEIGIVNEPLMKIGDYADTVSMEQAGVSIPTNKGSTTLDVDTTIKPSNVYIKYRS